MDDINALVAYSMSLGTNKVVCVDTQSKLPPSVEPKKQAANLTDSHENNKYDEYGLMNLYGDEKRCSIL